MSKQSTALLEDGRILDVKFREADELIVAGELDFQDFTSELARKVIYLQRELSPGGTLKQYNEKKSSEYMQRIKHFLTELKDGSLTESDCSNLEKRLKMAFPKLIVPKALRK